MKRLSNNQQGSHGFTIIELLTVMSIIVILISLLTPALNRVRRYSMDVKQRAQFHSIGVALDLFSNENEGYPNSTRLDTAAVPLEYCGAMKLAEAMVGQDLKGFNPVSRFRRDGMDSDVAPITNLYPPKDVPSVAEYAENVKSRKTYLELERANAYQIADIYDAAVITSYSFVGSSYVLCDSFNRVTNKKTGKKLGMPILYYKADTAKSLYPDANVVLAADSPKYIYNHDDNQQLIDMGMPWYTGVGPPVHPLASAGTTPEGKDVTAAPDDWPKLFYKIVRDKKIDTGDKPYRADSYILMSAGYDGEYGSKDDIYNFID
jgi:prepilin-type N-terminal cleavage/methylation domain-containing protein